MHGVYIDRCNQYEIIYFLNLIYYPCWTLLESDFFLVYFLVMCIVNNSIFDIYLLKTSKVC